MSKLNLPSVAQVREALHLFIDRHLDVREYKGSTFFGTPFQDADGNDMQLAVGDVVGTPKISFGRLHATPAVSMATLANKIDVKAMTPEDRRALAEKLLAELE